MIKIFYKACDICGKEVFKYSDYFVFKEHFSLRDHLFIEKHIYCADCMQEFRDHLEVKLNRYKQWT